jgi:DNA repair photolyase
MHEILVNSVLNKKKRRDEWFLDDYTLNPYEGCSFNCQYCYIRGSKYGENMADTLSVKINAPEILDRQLAFRAKKNQFGIIALASATDPYLGVEEKYRITEGMLKVILKYRFPVLIITKSALVLRDQELLRQIDHHAIHASDLRDRIGRGVIISFSLSTLDEKLAATLEPGAPSPRIRLETMRTCKDNGFMVGVNFIPALPLITDSAERIEEMVIAAKNYGADYIFIGSLTLFGNAPPDSKTLYYKFLERTHPSLLPEYQRLYGEYFSLPRGYLKKTSALALQLCEKWEMKTGILR